MSVKQLAVLVLLMKYANAVFNEDVDSSHYFLSKVEDVLIFKNVSSQCTRHMKEYFSALRNGEEWAARMFDSGSKIPSGIIKGNFMDLGFFDECLEVEGDMKDRKEKIYGKYCIGSMSPKAISDKFLASKLERLNYETGRATDADIRIDLAACLPNSCSSSDMDKIYATFIGPDVMTFNEGLCQSKFTQPELDGGAIAAITFFGIIFGLLLVSTAYDVTIYYLEIKPAHSLFTAFSVFTNTKKLLSTSKSSNQISCLHGLRVISTMWVILCHTYLVHARFPTKNSSYIIEWFNNQFNMIIIGGTVSVDTFFLMSGLVIAYIYMGTVKKGTRFSIILYYLHRYLRLTPALAAVVLTYVTLLKHMGSGPLWPSSIVNVLIKPCEDYWWKSLLYIQNYDRLSDICVNQTWYIAVDTQLFLISPIVLIPLKYWPKSTIIATAILAALSILGGFLDSWFREYSMNMSSILLSNEAGPGYMTHYYTLTWARASPWLLGLILGYLIYKIKQKDIEFVMNKIVVLVLWTIMLGTLIVCVFCGHDVFIGTYNKVRNSFYISLLRPAWAIAVSWVIFACVAGYGGPINWFLSLPIFQVLSKLTFTLYLVHYAVIYIVLAPMRTAPMFDNSYMFHAFWGTFMYCTAVALFITLAFESPIIAIEKVIFGRERRKPAAEESNNNETYRKSREIV